ncbi:MAG: hypothetical protein PHI23_01945 [Candidatus Peribacteraceae bacterium]|nr:hypothetical protein [Candidatus Peribacteraceae bacterium]
MEEQRPTLVKQLLGATVGVVIALSLYGAYEVALPPLMAWVDSGKVRTAPEGLTSTARINDEVSRRKYESLAIKSQKIVQHFTAKAAYKELVNPVQMAQASSSASGATVLLAQVQKEAEEPVAPPTPPPPPPASRSTSPRAEMQRQRVQEKLAETEKLPNSGPGLWLGMGGSLVGAVFVWRRMKRALPSAS